MKIIRNKWTRLIVFLISLALVCGCTLSVLNMALKYNEHNSNYTDTGYYWSEGNQLYTDLWAFSNIYIRNLDENGILSNNSYKTPFIKDAMKTAGFEVDYKHANLRGTQSFDYSVGNAGRLYTYSSTADFIDDEYTFTTTGNEVTNPTSYLHGIDTGCWYYTNGMGFEYYYLSYYNRGIAVYDYDTTGLTSYVDELGAVIYLNEDGSSPIPTRFREDAEFTAASDYVPFFEGSQAGSEIKIRLKQELLTDIEEYHDKRAALEQETTDKIVGLIPVAIIIALLTIYLIFTAGYDSKEQKYKLSGINRIYTEIHLIMCVFAAFALRLLLEFSMIFRLKDVLSPDVYNISVRALYLFGIGGIYTVIVLALSAIILRIRLKKLVDTTLVLIILRAAFRLMKKALREFAAFIKENRISRQMIKDNTYLTRFLIRTAVALSAGFVLLLILIPSRSAAAIIFALIIIVMVYIFLCIRDLRELSALSAHIRRIAKGDYSIYDGNDSIATYGMHTHLNNISSGMEKAVEKQLKSERMKIDLVTNVSHDLKTPLTSIISYIDLLSKEELSPEARDYVTVLENKSAKLKMMVSDVFDLAKATSGTDVSLERIDAVVLLGQILGDLSDKIDKSGMEIRKNINADTAPVMADGKKLYRVMQNLIDNALKYSLKGTRIYITLDTDEENAVIKVQNISSYEMDFSADEITERFVRGDEARTGEGNGLGLSIAKSYTEVCGGSFNVEINGDSFTAVVSLPLTDEEN